MGVGGGWSLTPALEEGALEEGAHVVPETPTTVDRAGNPSGLSLSLPAARGSPCPALSRHSTGSCRMSMVNAQQILVIQGIT